MSPFGDYQILAPIIEALILENSVIFQIELVFTIPYLPLHFNIRSALHWTFTSFLSLIWVIFFFIT